METRKNPEKRDRAKMAEWDLEASLGGAVFTLEVKYDKYESRSGNIALEYFNVRLGKPSGVAATKSDLWGVVLQGPPATAWLARTADLRKFYETAEPFRDVPCGGDQNAAMKLYRRDEMFEAVPFRRLDGLSREEVVRLLRELTTH